MARITYGALITEIKGSVGGFTFQKNASGTIIRSRPSMNKKKTSKQTIQQTSFFSFLSKYSNLTLAQKNLWSAFAAIHTKSNAFGQIKSLTAQNWYISINQHLQKISEPLINTPPSYTLPTAPGAFSLIMTSTVLKLKFLPIFNPTNESILIWASPPISTTSQVLQKNLRLIAVRNIPPFSEIDIKNEWEDNYNISYPPSGTDDDFNIAVMVQSVEQRTGIASPGLFQINKFQNINYGIGYMQIGTTFIIS